MHTARVAFAGLSPLCEDILRAALKERDDILLVEPWTLLPCLVGDALPGTPELLFVELEDEALPTALRVLTVAAEPLKIVGLTADARVATLFSIREQRTVLFEYSPGALWETVAAADQVWDANSLDPRLSP